MNSSLRSFFPLEIVRLILRELNGDLPSIASLCFVSFGCLEEASEELYKGAVLKSDRGIVSFFCGTKLKPHSRLIPYLSLSQVQTLNLYSHTCTNVLVPHLVEKSGISVPPRLLGVSPLALERLSLLPASSTSFTYYTFDSFLLFILPHLAPIEVIVSLGSSFARAASSHDWTRTLVAWGSTFRSLTLCGSVGRLGYFLRAERRFILRDLPYVRSGGACVLTLDARKSQNREDETFVQILRWMGVFGMDGLKTKMVVARVVEKEWKKEIAKLSEGQRGRVELVVVEEGVE